ncbi:glycosyltransferase, partial [Staphylococcus aureus]|uniref:glycosyltransferase n=1 Tax=Staphylococcus aureus TaxID=1280 RepID=UPI00123E5107
MTSPRVSVLLVIRSDGEDADRALESVRSQRLDEALEIVVAVEAPSDRVPPAVAAWSPPTDVQVTVLPGENPAGTALDLHRGLAACRGRYVAVLSGDDAWSSPDELRTQVQLLDARPHLS